MIVTWDRSARLLLLLFALLWLGASVACSGDPEESKQARLVMTAFKYTGEGSSTDSILVATEALGRFIGERCVLFQMQYAPSQDIEISRFRGVEISNAESPFIMDWMASCEKNGVSCVPGSYTSSKREFVVQVDRYGERGGILMAMLYDKGCDKEGSVIARNSLQIGDLVPYTPDAGATEGSETGGDDAAEGSPTDAGGD